MLLYLNNRYVLFLLSVHFVIWKVNILWKRNLIITLQKILRFMFLISLWYEEKWKGNYDLLRISGNWERKLTYENMKRNSLINCHFIVILEIDCIYILLYLKLEVPSFSNLFFCLVNKVVLIIELKYDLFRFIYFAWGQTRL